METTGRAAKTTWEIQIPGLWVLPRRVVLTIADFSRSLWWTMVVGVPAILLLGGMLRGGLFAYGYFMYCAGMMMLLSQTSERFFDTTVAVDWDAGELAATYHMGSPSVFSTDHEVNASLDEVDAARFHSVGDTAMVRLYHGKLFATATAFPIPPESERRFRELLRRHDVEVRGEPTADSSSWVWGRTLITVLVVVVGPIAGVFVWPVQYAWAVLVVLALHAVVLPLQGT